LYRIIRREGEEFSNHSSFSRVISVKGFIVMAISDRLKSMRAWLGLSGLAARSSALPVLTTKMSQTILHSITDIMAAAVDVIDMGKDKDRAEDSINQILSVCRPRCRESDNYKISSIASNAFELGGYRETRALPGQKTAA
jgi:hypothetical protein